MYGYSVPEDGTRSDQYAIRVQPDGEIIWEYIGESTEEELVIDALETAEGELVLAVVVEEDAKLVKLGSDGSALWQSDMSFQAGNLPPRLPRLTTADSCWPVSR